MLTVWTKDGILYFGIEVKTIGFINAEHDALQRFFYALFDLRVSAAQVVYFLMGLERLYNGF